jgi:capsular exopolysaccharide synthesis family protein
VKNIISHSDPKSPISEAYRSIRTSIEFSNIDRDIKTIVVTSSMQGEGKSTTASNLAVSFANLGKKILLVDCDLRRPSIHKQFQITNIHGLTDIILNYKAFDLCIQRTNIENLDIVTSGQIPPNPSEMLSSNKMMNLVNSFKDNYDYIIMDTPPVGIVTDAAVLSSYCDGVIMVCASDEVDVEMAKIAKERLNKVNAKILGVVLNKMEIDKKKYQNYYYYGEDSPKKKYKKK